MERIASFLIIFGAILWLISVIFLGARWQMQMLSALIVISGIFVAHFWEELFRDKEGGKGD